MTLLLTSLSASASGKDNTVKLDVHCMIPSWYRASSPLKDTTELGGYAHVSNPPKPWTENASSSKPVFIEISDQEAPFMNIFKGFTFRIVNTTEQKIGFQAVDSALPVILEAYIVGQWKPIQFYCRSKCGNSYHILYLPSNSFWMLSAPIFHGETHTLLRLRTELLNGQFAYSREFYGYINKEQIIRKDTLIPEGVWDQINLGIMGPWDPKPEPEIPITTDDEPDDIDLELLELPPPGKHTPQ